VSVGLNPLNPPPGGIVVRPASPSGYVAILNLGEGRGCVTEYGKTEAEAELKAREKASAPPAREITTTSDSGARVDIGGGEFTGAVFGIEYAAATGSPSHVIGHVALGTTAQSVCARHRGDVWRPRAQCSHEQR
jgi:hypothetical protein